MEKVIILKPVFLNKILIIFASIVAVISATVFILLKSDINFVFTFLSLLFSIGFIITFYINRYSLYSIQFENNNIKLNYENKAFFKKAAQTLPLDKVCLTIDNKKITIKTIDGNTIAIIHNGAIEENDRIILCSCVNTCVD